MCCVTVLGSEFFCGCGKIFDFGLRAELLSKINAKYIADVLHHFIMVVDHMQVVLDIGATGFGQAA